MSVKTKNCLFTHILAILNPTCDVLYSSSTTRWQSNVLVSGRQALVDQNSKMVVSTIKKVTSTRMDGGS